MVVGFGATFRRLCGRCLLAAAGCLALTSGAGTQGFEPVAAATAVGDTATVVSDPLLAADQAPMAVSRMAGDGLKMAAQEVRVGRHKRTRPGVNHFYFGQCTWWVAHRRWVPWRGDAWAWWWNARRYGFAEGRKPRVGSIMVMGRSWWTPWGHVALVERVNRDGSFVVSEMNWWGVRGGGWDRVDYRRIRSMRGILGFIYY